MPSPRKRPEPKKNVPTRPTGDMDAQEREFWDLEADPGDTPPGKGGAEPPAEVEAEAPAPEAEGKEAADDASETPSEAEAGASNTATEPLETKANSADGARRNKKRPGENESRSTEKIALIVLGVLLLGVVIWLASLFVSQIPTEPKTVEVEFPVTGQFASVQDAETYWRRPDREKDRGIQREARIIPAALVTLGSSSKQGALRFFFENDAGQLIGDSSTAAFTAGKFTGPGAAQIEVHSTGGFKDTGDHAAYVTGQIDHWFLIIKEGPDERAPGREFKQVLRIPISTKRK